MSGAATAVAVGVGIGAAVGGVSAAISGGDIGMGILGGAVGGGLTGGLAGPIGGTIGGEFGGTLGGLAAGAVGGVANAAITGGDPLMGGLMGGAMGGLAGGMGSYDSAMNEWNSWMSGAGETGALGSGMVDASGAVPAAADATGAAPGVDISGGAAMQGPLPNGQSLGELGITTPVSPASGAVQVAELAPSSGFGQALPQYGPEIPGSMAQGGIDATGRVHVFDPNMPGAPLPSAVQRGTAYLQDAGARMGYGQGSGGMPSAAYGPTGAPASTAGSLANVAKPSLMSDPIGWAKANPLPAAAGGLTLMSMLSGGSQQPQAQPVSAAQPMNSSFNQPLPQYTWTGGTRTQRAYTPAPLGYNAGRQGEWNYFPYSSQMTPMKEGGKVAPKNPRGGLSRVAHPGGQDDVVPILGARGEYMIPADVVSHLGDGHTDAGAAKLDGMVKNVRKSKGARSSLPPRSRPNPLSYVARSA